MSNHPFDLLPFYLVDCKALEISGQDNNAQSFVIPAKAGIHLAY